MQPENNGSAPFRCPGAKYCDGVSSCIVSPLLPPLPRSTGASDLRDQAYDQHPADDDLPEPEERLLPAAPARKQAGPRLPGGGTSDPAGGGDPAGGEEETRPRFPPQERTQGQGPLFCRHERTRDQRLKEPPSQQPLVHPQLWSQDEALEPLTAPRPAAPGG